jgi:hypothetical protein
MLSISSKKESVAAFKGYLQHRNVKKALCIHDCWKRHVGPVSGVRNVVFEWKAAQMLGIQGLRNCEAKVK